VTGHLISHTSPVAVLGSGSALPAHRFRNEELLDRVSGFLPGRLRRRATGMAGKLGIEARFFSRPFFSAREAPVASASAPYLGASAVQNALESSGLRIEELELLIGHTTTPHTLLPSNAAWIAERLAFGGPHVELRQACTGFAAAAVCAAALIDSGVKSVAVAGTEVGSVMLDLERLAADPEQLVNLMQMGDGAAAVILGPMDQPGWQSRLEALFYGSLPGAHPPAISLPRGGSGAPSVEASGITHFRHDYSAIRDRGARLLIAGLAAAESLGVERSRIDWYLPQQVNGRMAEFCARTLGVPGDRVIAGADSVGNVGSAAMWLALDRLRRSGRLRPGHRVLVLGAEASKFMFGGFLYIHAEGPDRP